VLAQRTAHTLIRTIPPKNYRELELMMIRRLYAITLAFAVAGCAERRPPSPLAQLAKEPLQAGVGLGDLKLQETTLGTFTRKYGNSDPVVTTEQTGTRIDFIKQGMAFLFRGDPACAKGLAEQMSNTGEKRDVNAFLLQNPDCETMLLESIAAYIPPVGEPLYEGETVEGIGLNAARELAERAYKATVTAVNALEMGEPMPEQELLPPDQLRQPGIRIYLGKDANGREVVRRLEIIPRS
jgi:hypothetical protein